MSCPGWIAENHPIARLTTVGTGGPARWYAPADTSERLGEVLAWAQAEAIPVAVVGLGSNLLGADAGYDGVVVKLVGDLAAVSRDGEHIECGGGAPLAVIVRRSRDWELAGIEFGCAIPGTAGGAVRMNAGAYGSEMRDVLESAVVVSAEGQREGDPDALGMTYRRSALGPGEVVASARLRLRPADGKQIAATIRDMQRRRRDAQPSKVRTFGSVWKNPGPDHTAGRMLEECGLKGYQVGGARISPVHANFIENTGTASSADVIALMTEARRRVQDRFGLTLEHEVQFLGDIDLPDA